MSPLLKNVALAFVAGFVTSLSAFMVATDTTDLPAAKAAGLAAIYAGVRGAVGFLKAQFGDGPFEVDTEAGEPDAL